MLRQAFAHCGRFLAAASRRSRGRVSVPVWLAVLSDQLPITATVGRYPAVKLIGRRPLPGRPRRAFPRSPHRRAGVRGIARGFPRLSPAPGQVAHVLRTRPPRDAPERTPVRLACIRHAASVDPEPGSNSPPRRTIEIVQVLLCIRASRSVASRRPVPHLLLCLPHAISRRPSRLVARTLVKVLEPDGSPHPNGPQEP